MTRWVSLPRIEGRASRQAHADLPEGTFEREVGRDGFFGPATHIYHQNAPTAWVACEGDARPRAFDLNKLSSQGASPASAFIVAYNAHVVCSYWLVSEAKSNLYRNADGDLVLFFHRGAGDLFCDYGHMPFVQGDYILIPRGAMWRLEFSETPAAVFMIEARNEQFGLPDKGLLGEHALFDPAMLDTPEINDQFKAQYEAGSRALEIKRLDTISHVTYPFNPLDAVGWKGNLVPLKINWRNIREVLSDRYHLPPSAHSTFVAPRVAICSFCPRPLETDPGALRVPFFHNNDDYDELVFFHHGDFFSRDGMGVGMMTFHAAGVTHGPHPNAYENSLKNEKKFADEMALNIDTRDPLIIPDVLGAIELPSYSCSWTGFLDNNDENKSQ